MLLAVLLVGSTTVKAHWVRVPPGEPTSSAPLSLDLLARVDSQPAVKLRQVGVVVDLSPDRSSMVIRSGDETFSVQCEPRAEPPSEPIPWGPEARPPDSATGPESSQGVRVGDTVEVCGQVAGRSSFGLQYLDGTFKVLETSRRGPNQDPAPGTDAQAIPGAETGSPAAGELPTLESLANSETATEAPAPSLDSLLKEKQP